MVVCTGPRLARTTSRAQTRRAEPRQKRKKRKQTTRKHARKARKGARRPRGRVCAPMKNGSRTSFLRGAAAGGDQITFRGSRGGGGVRGRFFFGRIHSLTARRALASARPTAGTGPLHIPAISVRVCAHACLGRRSKWTQRRKSFRARSRSSEKGGGSGVVEAALSPWLPCRAPPAS